MSACPHLLKIWLPETRVSNSGHAQTNYRPHLVPCGADHERRQPIANGRKVHRNGRLTWPM